MHKHLFIIFFQIKLILFQIQISCNYQLHCKSEQNHARHGNSCSNFNIRSYVIIFQYSAVPTYRMFFEERDVMT